jgi:hypothetical protein
MSTDALDRETRRPSFGLYLLETRELSDIAFDRRESNEAVEWQLSDFALCVDRHMAVD